MMNALSHHIVMAGLVPAIHVLLQDLKDVDARHKAGHDDRVGATLRSKHWQKETEENGV
jgi:hypothetical protein